MKEPELAFVLGTVLFALAIIVSVGLHEAGHMWTARAFGMKVTRFFIGFGPTLWSFRRGDTEYGVKGIPLGAFVKIVGMTPQDEDVDPKDEPRAMWRFPVWKRTIVMSAGSVAHFVLGFVILWAIFAFTPMSDQDRLASERASVASVSECVTQEWQVDAQTGRMVTCDEAKDPASPAKQAGLREGDVITAIDGQDVASWNATTEKIRGLAGRTVPVTYLRDGQPHTVTITIGSAERVKDSVDQNTPIDEITDADLENVGMLGVSPRIPTKVIGPVGAFGAAGTATGDLAVRTVDALQKFPQKVPRLWAAVTGAPRDVNTPVSMIGAARIGGELAELDAWANFFFLLATLNFFVGIFNLLPILPLDGGHIAIAWFEKARSWFYARLGKPDPGRVDYYKLMPVTYAIIVIFGGFTLLTLAADIINPITIK